MNYISYIDPGTGSMLFSLFIGIAAALSFGLRAAFLKIKFVLSGGKAKADDSANVIPFVIYSDHKRYWNIFKPVCDEFENRKVGLVYYTSSEDDPALSADYKYVKAEFIGEGNKAFAKLNFLKADILLATTPGLDVYQWKRSPDVKYYIHIPHLVDDLASYRMFGLDYFDAILTTGDNQVNFIRKIESLRPGIKPKDLTTIGSTYMDEMKKKFDALPPRPQNDKTVVLVGPSWGKSGILSRYGAKLLEALTKHNDFDVVVRPHPQSLTSEKELIDSLKSQFPNVEWNFDNDNFAVLNRSDILITDFSGIIYDYTLIFNRPLIYADTNFDTLPYDADWLDEPMWSLRKLPELGTKLEEKDFDRIGDVINEALNSDKLAAGRNEVLSECWHNIGKSAASCADYMIKKQKELTVGEANG